MDSAAPTRSTVMNKLRSSFSAGGSISPLVVSTPTSSDPITPTAAPTQASVSTSDALAILDSVVSEVEQAAAQAQVTQVAPVVPLTPVESIPTPPAQTSQDVGFLAQAAPVTLDQMAAEAQAQQAAQYSGPSAKESIVASHPPVETATGIQYVEEEKSPEIPPEVSEYLHHVEDQATQAPQEIVIGQDQQQTPLATHYPKQSVVVLPITPEEEKMGQRQGPKASFRWLVEWSRKLMKVFSGQIIYRQVAEEK